MRSRTSNYDIACFSWAEKNIIHMKAREVYELRWKIVCCGMNMFQFYVYDTQLNVGKCDFQNVLL